MQKNNLLLSLMLLLAVTSCVQPVFRKTITVYLKVKGKNNIESVGIRGNGKPLSWNADYPMSPVVKDSLYVARFTVVTGYKTGEIKFTVNGDFELKNQPNRVVNFPETDSMVYRAVYDQR